MLGGGLFPGRLLVILEAGMPVAVPELPVIRPPHQPTSPASSQPAVQQLWA